MSFKRMEGFTGSVPQGFIDRNVKICPLCGTDFPHWSLSQKMQMKLEGNLYLFKCEQCGCIISSPVADVTGYNNTVITTTGLLKRMSGKKNGVIYMKIQDAGASGANHLVGKEFTIQEINQMGAEKNSGQTDTGNYY